MASPTFNSDGTRGFWATTDGIQVASFAMATSCGTAQNSTTIAAGGTSPDWGPAEVPAPRPAPVPAPATSTSAGSTPAASTTSARSPVVLARTPVSTASTSPAASTTAPVTFTIDSAVVKLSALRRGRTTLRLTAGRAGEVRVRLSSGSTTIATGRKTMTAGTTTVRLTKPSRRALAALRGRGSALVTSTLVTPGHQRLEQSRSVRLR